MRVSSRHKHVLGKDFTSLILYGKIVNVEAKWVWLVGWLVGWLGGGGGGGGGDDDDDDDDDDDPTENLAGWVK